MPLKISKQIEIRHSQKVGRNEPCFCGSGKKYKKCCLKKEQEYSSGVGKGQTSRLVDWAMSQSFFREVLEKKIKEFFGKEKIEETEFYGLIEALIFEEKINGKKPLERFIESASLSEEERLIYQSWLERSFFSIFEVTEVNLGKSLKLRDLVREQDYFVLERMGTYQIEKGDILATRLLPFQEFWMLGGGLGEILARESDENYWLRRNLKNMPSSPNLELDFIKVFYGKKKTQKKRIENLSYEEVKDVLSDLLEKHQISYQIKDLEAMILENKIEPQRIIEKLVKKAINREELDEWTDIVYHYWHSHPKLKEAGEAGPREKIFVNQMMMEFNQMMMGKNLEELSTKEIKKLSDEFSERWFNTPQKELGGKTPKEVIVEERTSRGFKEEPEYKLSFTPIPTPFPPQEEAEWVEKYNLATRLMAKEYRFLEALELFSQLYPRIDLLEEEKFRWYGKVAICIINLGEIELGKKYLKKSLELNPNYDVSLKNLKALSESKNLEKIKNHGKQELFYSLLEKEFIFPISETENEQQVFISESLRSRNEQLNQCELLLDVISFLEFLAKNSVPVSLKQRLLRFNDVLVINKKLIQPDPEIVEVEDFSSPYRYEWQMPKVRFLHLLTLAGKLAQEKKNKLVLTSEGEKFLTKNKEKQFSQIFRNWFIKLDWKTVEDVQWHPNLFGPLMEVLQIQSWQIFETLKKFGEKKFNRQEFLDNIFPSDIYDKEGKFFKDFSLFFINKAILEYLSWANIIRPEEKTKTGLFAEYDKFSVTRFGLILINSIYKEMDNAIPSFLKNLV